MHDGVHSWENYANASKAVQSTLVQITCKVLCCVRAAVHRLHILNRFGRSGFSETERQEVADEISDCLMYAVRLADRCWIDLPQAILAKIELNSKKYPVDLVRSPRAFPVCSSLTSTHTQARRSAQKYVAYASVTKIDAQANQKQAHNARLASEHSPWLSLDFNELASIIQDFASAREWDRFHTPRDIALALTGEVGELCECFQWKEDEFCEAGLASTCLFLHM